MMLVGAAGPASNILLALLSAALVWLTCGWSLFLAEMFVLTFVLNVVLATLNLVPVPPLDGSRVVGGLLPRGVYEWWLSLDRYGNFVFTGLILILIAMPGAFHATIGAVVEWSFRLLPGG